jgi:hypothetical protein
VVSIPAAFGWYLAVRLLWGVPPVAEELGLGRVSVAIVALLLQVPLAIYVWIGHWTGMWSLLWGGI